MIIASLLMPQLAGAQDIFNTNSLTGASSSTADARVIVVIVINILLGILGLIVLVGNIYGGYLILTADADKSRSDKGRKIVAHAAIGLLIIFLVFAITNFVFNALPDSSA